MCGNCCIYILFTVYINQKQTNNNRSYNLYKYYIVLTEMFGRYSRPAHMFTTSARA